MGKLYDKEETFIQQQLAKVPKIFQLPDDRKTSDFRNFNFVKQVCKCKHISLKLAN